MEPTWKTKKGKTSKFLNAGGYNKNERAGNWRLGRQIRVETCCPWRPTGKRPLGRPRHRWEDNIRMDLEEIGINAGN